MDRNLLGKLKKISLSIKITNQVISNGLLQEKSTQRRRRAANDHIDDREQMNMLKNQW